MPNTYKEYPGLIRRLQETLEDKGWTVAAVIEKLAEQEHDKGILAPSERTIRKVFSDGGAKEKYNYNLTLRPLATLFFDNDDGFSVEDAQIYYEQAQGLLAVIAQKNDEISHQADEIKELQIKYEHALAAKEYLKEQLEKLHEILSNITKQS